MKSYSITFLGGVSLKFLMHKLEEFKLRLMNKFWALLTLFVYQILTYDAIRSLCLSGHIANWPETNSVKWATNSRHNCKQCYKMIRVRQCHSFLCHLPSIFSFFYSLIFDWACIRRKTVRMICQLSLRNIWGIILLFSEKLRKKMKWQLVNSKSFLADAKEDSEEEDKRRPAMAGWMSHERQ